MTSYARTLEEHRRLALLRTLAETPAYEANASLLRDVIDAEKGVPSSRDQVETSLAWLEEQGLVELRRIAGITVAKLTGAGADVAAGRSTVPGVKRPAPGAG